MNLAIMQPYLFPYIGYFHLVHAVDSFVFYNDVNFIKGGWIHRNKILVNKKEYMFSTPLEKVSSFVPINETKINNSQFGIWQKKMLKTISQAYAKAPFYHDIFPLIEQILEPKARNNIGDLAISSVKSISNFLELNVTWYESANQFPKMDSDDRITRLLRIASALNTNNYINAAGGKKLYSQEDFNSHKIKLNFINSKEITYSQFGNEFVPNLSIIDTLMFNSKVEVHQMLNKYTLEG